MIVMRTLGVLAAALSCAAATAVPAVAAESKRIVGGSPAPAGAWPSIAYLRGDYHDGNGDAQGSACTGSVVAPQWIVTAAHCTMGEQGEVPAHMEATLGVTDPNDPAGESIAVDRFVPDPSYDSEAVRNDVGLVHLAQPTSRPPMPLATTAGVAAGLYSSPAGVPNAAGWGAVDEDGTQIPSQLQQAYLEVRPSDECKSLISGFDPATQTCAGTKGSTTACFGDSGGPLTETASGAPVLWGITSYGPETDADDPACSVDEPTVYTWVPAYTDFIQSTIARPPSESGTAPAPDTAPAHAATGSTQAAARAATPACKKARAIVTAARGHERTAQRRLRGARRAGRRHRAGTVARRRTRRALRRYRAARAHRRRAAATAARRCR
jgi:secreted trypsin-like serine protease